jgi:hypothetical protein
MPLYDGCLFFEMPQNGVAPEFPYGNLPQPPIFRKQQHDLVAKESVAVASISSDVGPPPSHSAPPPRN